MLLNMAVQYHVRTASLSVQICKNCNLDIILAPDPFLMLHLTVVGTGNKFDTFNIILVTVYETSLPGLYSSSLSQKIPFFLAPFNFWRKFEEIIIYALIIMCLVEFVRYLYCDLVVYK